MLNLEGRVIPVVNIRRRFHLPESDMDLTDQIIIAHTRQRTVAVPVDAVTGIVESLPEQVINAGEILPDLDYLAGVIKLPGDLVLIHDLDTFLSLEEEKSLDSALTESRGRP